MSNIHRLTMCEFLPTQTASAAEMLRHGEWRSSEDPTPPVGAWESLVGQLNRLFILQEVAAVELNAGALSQRTDLQPVRRQAQWLDAVKPLNLPPETGGVYELRIYDLIAGGLARYVPLLLDVLPAREKYSKNVGIWRSLSGNSDQLIHMWFYEDANQRATLRPAIGADPAWQRFVPQILPLIRSMESYFLTRIL
jgi:hypothetical protein